MVLYTSEIGIIDGKPTLRNYAIRNGVKFEFYRHNEDGKFVRNLYTTGFGTYVHIPGFDYGYSGYRYTATEEEWGKVEGKYTCFKGNARFIRDDETIEMLNSYYPNIKYMLRKMEFSAEAFFNILPIWKEHPKVEILIQNGFTNLAYNKNFWKMKPETQKKYIAAATKTTYINPTMEDLRFFMAGGTEKERKIIREFNYANWSTRKKECDIATARYLLNHDEINIREYIDYIHTAEKLGKDLSDPYWKFPSNFRKMHDKVIKQADHVRYVLMLKDRKRAERLRKRQLKEELQMNENYAKAVKKYADKVTSENELKVFVPQTITEYEPQAEILHQCIITCEYYKEVARKKCILVFITKNDVPYATAELIKQGRKFKLGQFYGDEHLEEYKAKPDAVDALNKWASTYKVKFAS